MLALFFWRWLEFQFDLSWSSYLDLFGLDKPQRDVSPSGRACLAFLVLLCLSVKYECKVNCLLWNTLRFARMIIVFDYIAAELVETFG